MRLTWIALLLTVAAFRVDSAAAGPKTFDGNWAIYVITEMGHCMRGYRMPLRIRDGYVTYNGRSYPTADFGISPRGAVAIRLVNARGADVITATGALNAKFGAGKWRSPTMKCTGRWRAEKL